MAEACPDLDPIFDPYPWAAPLEEVRLKRP
jgi:hypothetical protein